MMIYGVVFFFFFAPVRLDFKTSWKTLFGLNISQSRAAHGAAKLLLTNKLKHIFMTCSLSQTLLLLNYLDHKVLPLESYLEEIRQ